MQIEQRPPDEPNFLLVVLLFGAALLGIIILAYFFIHFDVKHLTFGPRQAHPTSQLVLPNPTLPGTTIASHLA